MTTDTQKKRSDKRSLLKGVIDPIEKKILQSYLKSIKKRKMRRSKVEIEASKLEKARQLETKLEKDRTKYVFNPEKFRIAGNLVGFFENGQELSNIEQCKRSKKK